MATSDAPLNVPNVTLALARGGMSGGAGSISWSGTVAHGQTLTITDSESRFGTRTNVKPLYVNLGDGKAGSSLGRDTADYWHSNAALSSDLPVGSITSSVRYDIAATGGSVSFGPFPFIFNDVRTPLIQYIERYYDFLNDAAGTTAEGMLNLKTNRYWAQNPNNALPDALMGYQFSESAAGNPRFYVETVDQTGGTGNTYRFYGLTGPFPGKEWLSEEFLVKQSSALAEPDGRLIHIRNAAPINFAEGTWVTQTSTYPLLMEAAYLDQVSNGTGSANPIYYGYQCWDTEYNGVYIGNAATRGACTKLVRQPQTSWSPSQISIQIVESQAPLASAFLYFRTGIDSWVSDNGVAL